MKYIRPIVNKPVSMKNVGKIKIKMLLQVLLALDLVCQGQQIWLSKDYSFDKFPINISFHITYSETCFVNKGIVVKTVQCSVKL